MQSCNNNSFKEWNINIPSNDLDDKKEVGSPKNDTSALDSNVSFRYEDIASKYIKKSNKIKGNKVGYDLSSNAEVKKNYSDNYKNDLYSDSESCSSGNEAVLLGGNEIAHTGNKEAPQVSRSRGLSMSTFCNDLEPLRATIDKFQNKKKDLVNQYQAALKQKNKIVKVIEDNENSSFYRAIAVAKLFIANRKLDSIKRTFERTKKDQAIYSTKINKTYGALLYKDCSVNSREFSDWMRNFMVAPLDNKKDAEKYINLINRTKKLLTDLDGYLDKDKSKQIIKFWNKQEDFARRKFPDVNPSSKPKNPAKAPNYPVEIEDEKIEHQSNVAPLQNRLDSLQSEVPAWKKLREFTYDSSNHFGLMALYITQSADLERKINVVAEKRAELLKVLQASDPTIQQYKHEIKLQKEERELYEEKNLLTKKMLDSQDFIEKKYGVMMFHGNVKDAKFENFLDGYKYGGSTNMSDRLNYLQEIDNAKAELGKENYWPKNKSDHFRDFLDQQGKKLKNEMKLEEQRMPRKDNQSTTKKEHSLL